MISRSIGVKVGAEARAYPIKLMNYHDVINDTLGGEPIVVVWSAMAYAPSAMYRDQLTFGSAGLVFQGAIVMYSKDDHPDCGRKEGREVLSLVADPAALHRRGARGGPAQAASGGTGVMADVENPQPANHRPHGNQAGAADQLRRHHGHAAGLSESAEPRRCRIPCTVWTWRRIRSTPKRASSASPIRKAKRPKPTWLGLLREKTGPFEDTVGDRKLTLQFNPDTLILSAKDAEGKPVLTEAMLWIAWLGAHPNTEVWQEDRLLALRAAQTASASAGTSAPATTAASGAPTAPAPAPSMPAATGAPADTVR